MQTTPSSSSPTASTPSTAQSTAASPGGALQPLGTFAVTSTNEAVQSTIYVSQPILPGTDPSLTQPCSGAPEAATTVTIRGTITILYQGAIAGSVELDPSSASINTADVSGGGQLGYAAFQNSDNSFTCSGQPVLYQMQPGQSITLPWQADLGLISNAEPTFTAAEKSELYLDFYAKGADQGLYPDVHAAGPNAADCANGQGPDALFLYSRPPFTFHVKDVYGDAQTLTCQHA